MKTHKFLNQKLLKLHLIIWILIYGLIYLSAVRSQFIFSINAATKEKRPDFSGEGRPGRRQTSGDSRSGCPEGKIAALMPTSNQGKTIAEHPTLWFYVSYSPQQAPQGKFVLQDEDENDIKRTSFTLPKTPGLVSITIPISLQVNKKYFWQFQLYCNPEKSPVFVEGWIERITVNSKLKNQLETAKLRKDIVYINHLIWYDAVAYLAHLRFANSTDNQLETAWKNLLVVKGISLEEYSQYPLVGSVIFSEN